MFNANNTNGISGKFLNRMFRKIDGLVWDLQTGTLGIKTENGIYTLTNDTTAAIPATAASEGVAAVAAQAAVTEYGISVNPFDAFGFSIPAFATQVPLAGIKEGDLIVGDKAILGWVTGRTAAGLKLLDVNGMNKNYTPPKVAIMNQDGALVVQSLGGLFGGQAGVGGLQSSLMPLLMMSGGDSEGLESILPLMLFGQLQQTNPTAAAGAATAAGAPAMAASPMANMMPILMLQALSKKTKSGKASSGKGLLGDIDPMMMMMLGGGMGGQGGGINPMMLMALGGLGKDDGDDEVVSLPVTRTNGNFTPALQTLRR